MVDAEVKEAPVKDALVEAGEAPPANLFIVPNDNLVIFPEVIVPVVLKGQLERKTVEQAATQTEFIGVVLAKRDLSSGDVFDEAAVHSVGCVAKVLRTLRLPDDSLSVVLRGLKRFRIQKFLRTRPYVIARVEYPDETRGTSDEAEAMLRVLRGLLKRMLATEEQVPDEFKVAVANIDAPRALADFAATWFVRERPARQGLLEAFDVQQRLERVIELLTREVGLRELGQRIREHIRERMEKQQRDFFLREQLKEIRQELGEAKDEKAVAIERLEQRLTAIAFPEEVGKRVGEELERLKLLPLESPESSVLRNYLDWIASLPWDRGTVDRTDLDAAEKLLAASHFGLGEVKERILEFLAVKKLKPDHRGPILCFVGPPGVGKTSLGRAIAESLGRKFVRISLGGVRDEAEIRGHRRTYIGALPGRILQGLKTAETFNPVFMLDEIDKLASDFRGDPASALLEALDPEQNHRFSDHYLEVPFDLSRVMFVATANSLATIPPALLDRLEVIEIPGYTAREKAGIAQRYLLPRQIERHGLKPRSVRFDANALAKLLRGYTREPGVRNLEQQIARVCRKIATRTARGRRGTYRVSAADLKTYLGAARFSDDRALTPDRPGVVVGLSWTPVGGEALSIEASAVRGSGKLELTGMLGGVMLESAKIALSHVRSAPADYGFDEPNVAALDIHVHVPSGAVPKDGPSAGITMATALVSLLRREPIRRGIAMTGELTLTGKVLPVGGLRDKILAAKRAGMRRVIVPAANRPQIEELTAEARAGLEFDFVEDFREVVAIAFARNGKRRSAAARQTERPRTGAVESVT